MASDGKPSLFLSRLRALNVNISDQVLRTIFIQHLPPQVRAVLAMASDVNLQELAIKADRVAEAFVA